MARKTDKTAAPVEIVETVETVPAHETPNNPPNVRDWHELVIDGIAADNADTADIMAASRRIGSETFATENAASGNMIVRATIDAFDMIEDKGYALPTEILLSAVARSEFKGDKKDKDDAAFDAQLAEIELVVERLMVDPAVNAWLQKRGETDPKFVERAKMARKDCEAIDDEYKNAAVQLASKRTDIKRSCMLAPVLPILREVINHDGKVFQYGGAGGYRDAGVAVRKAIGKSVRFRKLVTLDEVRELAWQAVEARKVAAPKPENDAAIEAAFKPVLAAVTRFSKWLNDEAAKTTGGFADVRHVDAWVAIRGQLDGMKGFPFDLVEAGKLVPQEKTAEEQAADEKAAEQAKLDALNEADAADAGE